MFFVSLNYASMTDGAARFWIVAFGPIAVLTTPHQIAVPCEQIRIVNPRQIMIDSEGDCARFVFCNGAVCAGEDEVRAKLISIVEIVCARLYRCANDDGS